MSMICFLLYYCCELKTHIDDEYSPCNINFSSINCTKNLVLGIAS